MRTPGSPSIAGVTPHVVAHDKKRETAAIFR
jgi:hypothetical protein